MEVLIADDNAALRHTLISQVTEWGFRGVAAVDGTAAWQLLQKRDRSALAILDWDMPGMDGVEVCRRARVLPDCKHCYFIMLTGRTLPESSVWALREGADDYLTKPVESRDLHARLLVGRRIVELERGLADRVTELEHALAQVHQLQGLLPICMYCKRIRDDQDYWHQIEGYIAAHSQAEFSHGICPDCYRHRLVPETNPP